jgi:hypothetical protein
VDRVWAEGGQRVGRGQVEGGWVGWVGRVEDGQSVGREWAKAGQRLGR